MPNGNGSSTPIPSVRLHPQSTWIPLSLVLTLCTMVVGTTFWLSTHGQSDHTSIRLLTQRMEALEVRFEKSQEDWQTLFRDQQSALNNIQETIVDVRIAIDRLARDQDPAR